jgi:hypothetical protein
VQLRFVPLVPFCGLERVPAAEPLVLVILGCSVHKHSQVIDMDHRRRPHLCRAPLYSRPILGRLCRKVAARHTRLEDPGSTDEFKEVVSSLKISVISSLCISCEQISMIGSKCSLSVEFRRPEPALRLVRAPVKTVPRVHPLKYAKA